MVALDPALDRLAVDSPDQLVDRLTLEQKVRLLTGADFWALHDEPAVGLRRIVTSDGPAGIRGELWDERDSSINIPSATALAASWDVELLEELGRLLAFEARRKGVDVVLAPTVNLHRSPYGGRHFECFSEDPLLTGQMGAALVTGLQSQGVAATVKHFVANDSETDRLTVDARVEERVLRELYLAPFERIVREAGVWAVMAAYNSVNGSTMTESPLLGEVLAEEWGFDGVTMTDWYAGRSTVAAARAGLDLLMPGPTGPWGDALAAAVREGLVPESAVDAKVERILRLADRVGALAGGAGAEVVPWQTGRARDLARRAASAGFVLLRNQPVAGTPVLPVDPDIVRSVAVLGPNARDARFLGGGSALVFPESTVSPLEGLEAALGADVDVRWSWGARSHDRVAPADPRLLATPDGEPGLLIEFRGRDGRLLGTDQREGTAFNWNNAYHGVDPAELGRIQLRATLTADVDGDYRIGASGVGRYELQLDGAVAFDELLALPDGADPVESLMRPPQAWADRRLAAGESVDLVLTHTVRDRQPGEDLIVAMQLNAEAGPGDEEDALQRAVDLAARSDVAIVVVGTSEEVESEGFDRTSLALPGRQDELVRRVAAACPRTVVVVNAGSPVLMPWTEQVAAVLVTWFPGQEFGNALGDVVLGRVEPGGRLPTTWPVDESAPLPTTTPSAGVLPYDEGLHVGYRRFLRDGVEPAFWFGHGLGYTTWALAALTAEPTSQGVRANVEVTNTGARSGRTVLQVYVSRHESAIERPVRWLAGHALVSAEAGRTVTVPIDLPRRAFSHWDSTTGSWSVEPGSFAIETGPSAGHVHLRATVVPGGP